MTDDISDEARALEQKLRGEWGIDKPLAPCGAASMSPLKPEYHFYSRQLPSQRGESDTYWRIDRIQGDSSAIHREFNSKMLALMEVEKLRKAGFIVHAIQTPAELTLEALAKRRQEFQQVLDESKNTTEIIEKFIAAGRKNNQ
jgi:hypothetical protein